MFGKTLLLTHFRNKKIDILLVSLTCLLCEDSSLVAIRSDLEVGNAGKEREAGSGGTAGGTNVIDAKQTLYLTVDLGMKNHPPTRSRQHQRKLLGHRRFRPHFYSLC